jgi:hypothetical protein
MEEEQENLRKEYGLAAPISTHLDHPKALLRHFHLGQTEDHPLVSTWSFPLLVAEDLAT